MKQIILILNLIFYCVLSFAQEIEYKKYSYTEFFRMIENEQDSIFTLENAVIEFNSETDSLFTAKWDTITYELIPEKRKNLFIVEKAIHLDNVHFLRQSVNSKEKFHFGILSNIHFKRPVQIRNTMSVNFNDCIFDRFLTINSYEEIETAINKIFLNRRENAGVGVNNSILKESGRIFFLCMDIPRQPVFISCYRNEINLTNKPIHNRLESEFYLFGRNITGIELSGNRFLDKGIVNFRSIENTQTYFSNNDIKEAITEIYVGQSSGFNNVLIEGNTFNNAVFWEFDAYDPKFSIPYAQFKNHLLISESRRMLSEKFWDYRYWYESDTTQNIYKRELVKNDLAYKTENSQVGMLYDFYKSKYDKEDANALYIQMKDMETERLKFLHHKSPSFKTFFKWKINQFLKIFADYGTEPSKAIIFSMYVILFFALIYLFFPNSWDVHGKNRIIHRFTFFIKYMNRKQGIHEVYLEDKETELMEYNDFKNLIEGSSEKVPGFFKATALPLYKWAVSGTKITAALLSRVDVMKGTWEEVPQNHRWWKMILLISAFTIAIIYDIIIKILNALMLSINTFTTLGFGEIPIKGLPRYLAIIQGFIGWFMLTIFSVSLISQLLN